MTADHGYGRYTSGCRCDVCKAAKVTYTRDRRAQARTRRDAARAAGREYVATDITHGLYGYQTHKCRCFTCKLANAQASAKYRAIAAGGAR
jgi:hypothetical protein